MRLVNKDRTVLCSITEIEAHPVGQKGQESDRERAGGDRRRRKRGCLRKRESFSLMGQVGRFETEQAGRSGMREKGENLTLL